MYKPHPSYIPLSQQLFYLLITCNLCFFSSPSIIIRSLLAASGTSDEL